MPNLSIKNVPEYVVAKLRQRAVNHRRSLQGELLDIVCRSSEEHDRDPNPTEQAADSSGWLSIEEIAAELKLPRRRANTNLPLAVDILRQDRDTR